MLPARRSDGSANDYRADSSHHDSARANRRPRAGAPARATFVTTGAAGSRSVFRCCQGHDMPQQAPVFGLASKYPEDRAIENDPDVIFATGFESDDWSEEWTNAAGSLDALDADPQRWLKPFQGRALRVKIAKGSTGAMNVTYKFKKETGQEPEEIYFRYYLRLGNDWKQSLQGGKLPGISGTYGVAGWGGRRVPVHIVPVRCSRLSRSAGGAYRKCGGGVGSSGCL